MTKTKKHDEEVELPHEKVDVAGPEVSDEVSIDGYRGNGFFKVLDLPSGGKILMGPKGEKVSPIVGSDGIIPASDGQSIVKMCDTFNSTSPDVREYKRQLEKDRKTREDALRRQQVI